MALVDTKQSYSSLSKERKLFLTLVVTGKTYFCSVRRQNQRNALQVKGKMTHFSDPKGGEIVWKVSALSRERGPKESSTVRPVGAR